MCRFTSILITISLSRIGITAQVLACGVVPHFATFDEGVPDKAVQQFLQQQQASSSAPQD